MIDIEQATEIVLKNTISLPAEELELNQAFGRVLSHGIKAPFDHPFFDQTAVDGYAINFEDYLGKKQLKVSGEIQAGDDFLSFDRKGDAVRIFTGAGVPVQFDTVVMQERVNRTGDSIQIEKHNLKKGSNIRRRGEQIKKGDLALAKGTVLNASNVGFLAAFGINRVKVVQLPRVNFIATGGEFASPGRPLIAGQIYQSNGVMIEAALSNKGITCNTIECIDDLDQLVETINKTVNQSDILIISGGVSVGKYDYTKLALEELGFDILFHKVSQKPGKPMLFAKKGDKVVFGLPGNPRAVMVGYYMYVVKYLDTIMGIENPGLKKIYLPIAADFTVKGERDLLLAGQINKGVVEVLSSQQSHMLQTMGVADCILHLSKDAGLIKRREVVTTYLLE